jgi:phospholipase D1/2
LRKHLFREHLGLLKHTDKKIDVTDPTIEAFYKDVWQKISKENTNIFEEVFRCIPSDNVRNFSSLKKYTSDEAALFRSNPEEAEERLKRVHGFLCDLPLNFLCEEVS